MDAPHQRDEALRDIVSKGSIQILLHGVSVVRTKNGEITEWSDYYDGLTSRRTALAAHFTDWGEL
jgi:hypothetical protein